MSLSWTELCSIVANDRRDWKAALSHMHGINLITLSDANMLVQPEVRLEFAPDGRHMPTQKMAAIFL